MIFKGLTVKENLRAREVCKNWNYVISHCICRNVLFVVDNRSLTYRKEVPENVIQNMEKSALNVKYFKLSRFQLNITVAICLKNIGHHIQELVMDEVSMEEDALYYCSNELKNLQKLSLHNCDIKASKNELYSGVLLPKLVEIDIDYTKYQMQYQSPWAIRILENLLRFNEAILSLKIRVLFYQDHEDAKFIVKFGNRLKKLHMELIHPIILQHLCNNSNIKLTDLTIVGCTHFDYPVHIKELVEKQTNLRTLVIWPKIERFSELSIKEVLQNLKHLEHFGVTLGDVHAFEDIRKEITFDETLNHLDLKYFKYSLQYINAPHLRELTIRPFRVDQGSFDLIKENFRYLTKLSLHTNGKFVTLDFTDCFTKLENLEDFEFINLFFLHPAARVNITLFELKRLNQPINHKLKRIKIKNAYIDSNELEWLLKICPLVEDLSLIECGFLPQEVLIVIDFVCYALKRLKRICYTQENYTECKPPKSTKMLLDKCPELDYIEYVPELISFYGSSDILNRKFYESLGSILSIKHFYNNFYKD